MSVCQLWLVPEQQLHPFFHSLLVLLGTNLLSQIVVVKLSCLEHKKKEMSNLGKQD